MMMMITMMLIALHLDDDGVHDPYYSRLWQLADPSNPFNSNEDRIHIDQVTTAAPVIPAVPNPTMVAA